MDGADEGALPHRAASMGSARSAGLEICVDSVASAAAAQSGGASRLELCANLIEGGTTPSIGLLSVVLRTVSIPVHVMVRPRGGDFLYSPEEVEVMLAEIGSIRQAGAAGVVLGVLDAAGAVDESLLLRLVEASAPLPVTFHRAINVSCNLIEALEACRRCGVARILTSGGAPTAPEGAQALRRLVDAAAGRLLVAAGGGLTESNAAALVAATGVPEVHGSLRGVRASEMRHRPAPPIFMGGEKVNTPEVEFELKAVQQERVAAVVRALHPAGPDAPTD